MTHETILRKLCEVMTIAGNEKNAHQSIQEWVGDAFDAVYTDTARNLILYKACHKKDPKRILLDAHLDEVGFLVRSITDDGFVSVVSVGGIDRQILPGAECMLYGEKTTIPGVFLMSEKRDSVPTWEQLFLDTGYTKDELLAMGIQIGTPIRYATQWTKLQNERIAGQGFDDKCCAAALLMAVLSTPRAALAADVYISLSAGEEIGSQAADCAAFAIEPDIAIVTDVNFATAPGVSPDESAPLGEGVMTSLSAVTDRRLTDAILSLAERAHIPIHTVVETRDTGTNANSLVYTGHGVPAAVVSLPLAGMHSYTECLSLHDCDAFVRLIETCITTAGFCDDFGIVEEKGGRV